MAVASSAADGSGVGGNGNGLSIVFGEGPVMLELHVDIIVLPIMVMDSLVEAMMAAELMKTEKLCVW